MKFSTLYNLVLASLALVLFSGAIQSCRADTGRHLFILSGQSNMRQPLPDSFKEAVSQVFGEEKVIVVTHAHPSQPIRRWDRNWEPPEGIAADGQENGQLYEALMTRARKAIAGKELATVTFIWMQGEADAGKGWGAVYERSFLGVLDQIKQDLEHEKVNFVVGRINDHWLTSKGVQDGDLVRKIQVKLGEDQAHGAWVNTDDLNMGVNPWGGYSLDDGHFPPAGYRVMGQRFARKACLLIDPELEPDKTIFAATFLDTPGDIATHAAIGKPVTGTAPDPEQAGKAGLAALTDGKFGSTDPGEGGWVGCPPETKDASWIIDLGSTQELTSAAASILVNKAASAGFPAGLGFAVSEDGREFHPIVPRRGEAGVALYNARDQVRRQWNQETETQSLLVLVEPRDTKARYLKVTAKTGECWLYLDEITVNPVANEKAAGAGE